MRNNEEMQLGLRFWIFKENVMGNGSWQCSYTISTASAIGSCHGLGSSGGQNSRKKEIDAASVDK